MEFLGMMSSASARLWLAQSAALFFLIGGICLLAAGIGLIVNGAVTLRFFSSMNRWVSMRRATRPLEVPRDTRPLVQKHRYWLAAVFVAGGVFAIVGLVTQFSTSAAITLLKLNGLHPAFAGWLVDAFRWVLIIGNLTAIVAGILLAFFPAAVAALEARGSAWYSERQAARGADTMRVTSLDNWVAAQPRAAGAIVTLFALGLISVFGLSLPGLW